MNPRMSQLRALFDAGAYFKLVCGAGNADAREVERLAAIYTLAGANGFDVAAVPSVVEACGVGINRAYGLASGLGVAIPVRPFITVSVGVPGDHHVRKALITDACVACGKCIPACPTEAIPANLVVIRDRCIGCGACEAACPPRIAAIAYEHDEKGLRDTLPRCLAAGAENIELHAAVPDDDAILDEWRVVAEVQPDHFISMCLDRQHLSNTQLMGRIRQAHAVAGQRLIIQADGVPMSGGRDDANTTLQAIATADIIRKQLIDVDRAFKHLPVLLSGGTNSHTGALARACGVPFAGVAIGTHARKVVKPALEVADLWSQPALLAAAVDAARDLVSASLGLPQPA
ncbi:MAG: LdpA C-terminal domain-containing domain [Candidatus Sericytochromatia bacterium]|nr:LdpA C-terminal domain-containing domain [Candidatus Sericytochromatia bacterium]